MDKKLVVAYEILCLSTLLCTEWWHGSEKKSVPDALSLWNVNDAHHLEHLMWAVYDEALLVGLQPKLPGNHPWCTVLAGLYKHIYRGCDDSAHCPPYTLASWDCQEQTEVLRQEEGLALCRVASGEHTGPAGGPGAALDATPRHQPKGGWSEHSHGLPPNMLLSCHHGGPSSPDADTMPKLASAVNIPSHAWSSHSSGGMAQASLDERMPGRMTSRPNTCLSTM